MPAGNRGRPITGAPAENRAMLATVSLSSTGLRSLSDTTTAATLSPRCRTTSSAVRLWLMVPS